ncbi:DUF2933 domain-containing protein [Methylocystis hirsuta]|uniref:DUF2933 domain-containing protein n=1 Tax=Methylocystis hirsuta TaxID=369798 RepID=A0A3M9XJ45_9HYPH|nr:DUF2933 domain-containing protein [Methylocystis hirsuta]RNJ48177.1 DUF2933 domain-containing protein [Methylocystis hirsuta]
MRHEHYTQNGGSDSPKRGLLASRENWVLIGFLAIAGFYLVTEHTAHLFGALPYLLLLACPLMHIFMHRDHGCQRRRQIVPDGGVKVYRSG